MRLLIVKMGLDGLTKSPLQVIQEAAPRDNGKNPYDSELFGGGKNLTQMYGLGTCTFAECPREGRPERTAFSHPVDGAGRAGSREISQAGKLVLKQPIYWRSRHCAYLFNC
jgi:hypothetical protein